MHTHVYIYIAQIYMIKYMYMHISIHTAEMHIHKYTYPNTHMNIYDTTQEA